MTTDSTLPGHTIFAPKVAPPKDVALPFIAWGNGACTLNAGQYQNLLVEIASYGYVIAADGTPNGNSGTSQQSKVQDMRDSLDWAMAGKAAKYGNVDTTKITTAGHSCGGLEAMSTAYHDERVKRIMMFNIAIFQDDRRYLLQEIKVPVAYFIGGKNDMGYSTVSVHSIKFNSLCL
jgi:dienelactone hydrolase